MSEVNKLLVDIDNTVMHMLDDLCEGRENATEFSGKIIALPHIFNALNAIVPSHIMGKYNEFINEFMSFCKLCEDESFLIKNVDNVAESLSLLSECLKEIRVTCNSKIKKCACCGNYVFYNPLSDYYIEMARKYSDGRKFVDETLNCEEYLCPQCYSSDRDRLIVSFLAQMGLEHAGEDTAVLQIAPAKSIEKWIINNCKQITYETTDLYMQNVTFVSDIQDLKEISSDRYDIVICSHVLEHVENDIKALTAMKRVLKDNGILIFLVPVDLSADRIDEEFGCSEEENWRRFGQGDHCRRYSKSGLIDRLEKEFFVRQLGVEYFGEELFNECGLTQSSILYILTKNENVDMSIKQEYELDVNIVDNGPVVSVIMSAYNHEPYVAQAIESVINQSYRNIEFLVADDASPDGTVSVMRRYSKYYAKELYFNENKGDRSLDLKQYATGKYIALMHSDDLWDKDKIARQVEYLERHPECGVCLSWCEYVDENLQHINDNIFVQKNRSKEEWMNFFFKYGNVLCNPSSLCRAELFFPYLPYGSAGRQAPDLFRWTDIVQKTDIYIIQDHLVSMRRYTSNERENTSASNTTNNLLYNAEIGMSWMWIIRKMDTTFFKKAFADMMINPDAETEAEIKCEKYFLLLSNRNVFVQNSSFVYFTEIYDEIKDIMVERYHYSRRKLWSDELTKGILGSVEKRWN